MNTKYNLEVLGEVKDELTSIIAKASLIQDRSTGTGNFATFAESYVVENSAYKICNLLQDVYSAIRDRVWEELMEIRNENCLMIESFHELEDYYGYGLCCIIDEGATRISHLLQDVEGTIEEEDLRLYEIESRV